MVSRRIVILGGASAVAAAAVAVAGRPLTGDRRPGVVVSSDSRFPVAAAPPSQSASPAPPPAVTTIDAPAVASTPADRLDLPVRVDWIGGSDVALDDRSLPAAVARRVPTIGGRPVEFRTRVRIAVMAAGVEEMVREAIDAGTDAIVMSINPVWLHWDEVACDEFDVAHERYVCLLSPISADLTARREAELASLVATAAAADVPLFVYTQPHSAEVLANPAVAPLLEAAEAKIGQFAPQRHDVRFHPRAFTRDMPPLREGVEFIEMVHPTLAGVEVLADRFAVDLTTFWQEVALGA